MRANRDWFAIVAALLGVALVVSLSLQFWGLGLFGGRIDFERAGTWSSMLAGVGTTAAVGLSLAGIAIERRRTRRAQEVEVEQQLTDVHAWLKPFEGSDGQLEWALNLFNSTRTPVYRWRVEIEGHSTHLCSDSLGPIRPDTSELVVHNLKGMSPHDHPRVLLYFESADGRNWVRGRAAAAEPVQPTEITCPSEHAS